MAKSRYTIKKQSDIYDKAEIIVRSKTYAFKIKDGNQPKNYMVNYGKGTIKTSGVFFEIILDFTKIERKIFKEIFRKLKSSKHYVNGFVIEMNYKLFNTKIKSRNKFYETKQRFVDMGILIAIKGHPKHFVVNPDFIIKGKVTHPDIDKDGYVVDRRNITTIETDLID